MQVTIVQGAFLPVPPVAGGAVEKLWYDLGREFARQGLEVTHLSRCWPGLPARETSHGVHHRRIGSFAHPASALWAMALDLVYSLRCLLALERADVVVTNTFFLPMLLRLRPRLGPVYVSVHRYPRGQMAWYGNAARLQCVSTAVAEAVRRQSPAVAAKVKVVPNYVTGGRPHGEWAAAWPGRRREVLYVGRIHPEKGLELLLDAFAAIAPPARAGWSLRIVGPHGSEAGGGGDAYLALLRQREAALGLQVDWVGAVYDKAALDACYARAMVFVYPSVASGEAFGLAPLEAMAQGCPVITSDLACFRDFIEPGRNGDMFALDDGDGNAAVPGLRDRLLALMQDEPRRRRHAEAGLATAERFGLPRVAAAFIDDFRTLSTP